jgi:glycosyltransferase involved in cell wall biosynthesis
MRLALLGPAPPFRGGIVVYLAMLARVLEERGHELVWISFQKQYPRFLFPGAEQTGEIAPWLQHANEPSFVPWSPWSWRRTADMLADQRPDAVVLKYWIPFFAPGYWGTLARLRRRSPARIIYVLDNVIAHERYPLGRWLTRRALQQGHGFVAQSDQVRRDLNDVVPGIDPVRVITSPHPVYDFGEPGRTRRTRAAARAVLGLPADVRLVLCFGFIKPYKGVRYLIDAAPSLQERYGDGVRLLIVGDIYGDKRPYVERIAASGAADIIQLVDEFVPDAVIEDYFQAADLVVLPDLSATQSGIVQIAYNYDRPVVTTDVGGLPEVVHHERTGFLVPPGDAAALAQAITRFFDEQWGERLAAGVVAEKHKYSWDRLAEAIERLARSV